MKEYYTVQLVKHVNYTAYVEANSQEEAEQKAAEDTSKYDWVKMDGLHPTEICHNDGDYSEGECLE